MSISSKNLTSLVLALLAAASLAAGAGCAAVAESPSDDPSTEIGADDEGTETGTAASELRIATGLGANGDECTVRTNPDGTKVPGKEKDGECCSTADSTDCVIILKPFPKATLFRR